MTRSRTRKPKGRIWTKTNTIICSIVSFSGLLWAASMYYLSPSVAADDLDNRKVSAATEQSMLTKTTLRHAEAHGKTLLKVASHPNEHPRHKEFLAVAGNVQRPTALPVVSAPAPRSVPQESLVSCGGHHAKTCKECTAGHDAGWCNGECAMFGEMCQAKSVWDSATIPQIIEQLIKEYPFQPVRTVPSSAGVNIVLVRSPMGDNHKELVNKFKDRILFLGISSMEDFPLSSPNPFSGNFPNDEYVGMFPGWLHMFRHPEEIFPSDIKLLLQSQSDFALPDVGPQPQKQYDFVFSGTDQDVASDCVGWASFAKNWTFVKQALEVMCGEYGMTGVLVASKDKQGQKACSIPKICEGKVLQTSFLPQWKFFEYVRLSRFALLPQVHDASPRAATHALALDTPVLMNWHIMGGWKYINEKTGEFFHDMTDFRASLQKLMRNLKNYEPRKYMCERYGDEIQGARLKKFVLDNFGDLVKMPGYVRLLIPAGA